jgi:hypothetical protein
MAWFENECGAVAADGSIVTWGTAYLARSAPLKLGCARRFERDVLNATRLHRRIRSRKLPHNLNRPNLPSNARFV